MPVSKYFSKILEVYIEVLWLISWAVLFDTEEPVIREILDMIGHEGEDLLFEKLVGTRIKGRKPATHLCFPKPYRYLYEAICAAQPGEWNSKIGEFLKIYYPSMKSTYWYDSHLQPEGGFHGYWCFELAACVKAFHMDDRLFSDNMYYPKDLVHQ